MIITQLHYTPFICHYLQDLSIYIYKSLIVVLFYEFHTTSILPNLVPPSKLQDLLSVTIKLLYNIKQLIIYSLQIVPLVFDLPFKLHIDKRKTEEVQKF